MVIDEEIIKHGIDSVILSELINRHEQGRERLNRLTDYYLGKHDILARKRSGDKIANNRIICNHAKYIVDMAESYLVGNPITYASSENYNIEPIKNCYLDQDMASIDAEIEKEMSICGNSYELIYADENSQPRSVRLSPFETFVVYSQRVGRKPLFGVHYYRKHDIRGNVTGVLCMVCDEKMMHTYEGKDENFANMSLKGSERHYFGAVPILEYENNEERQGDFEQIISLINAYNLLMSDRVNDKEQFVEAFLFLSGIDLDSDQAAKLKEERILMGYEGARAEYLSKVMSESDVEILRNNIKQDIHRFSMVPDLSDETFGNNLSGVAIKYRLMGFEQHVKNKERYFSKTLKKRFEMYNTFLTLKGSMEYVPIHRVDVVFTKNMPTNDLELSQMVNNLHGIATAETLLAQLPFVADPKEEAELASREYRG